MFWIRAWIKTTCLVRGWPGLRWWINCTRALRFSVVVRVRKNAARAACEIGECQTTPPSTGDGRGRYSSSGLCRVACASVPRARVHFVGGCSSKSSSLSSFSHTLDRVSPSSVRRRAPPEHESVRPSLVLVKGRKNSPDPVRRLVRLVGTSGCCFFFDGTAFDAPPPPPLTV